MARSCLHCQRSKVHKHVHLQPEQIEVPRRRFAHVHVDLVGPLPRSAGFSYLGQDFPLAGSGTACRCVRRRLRSRVLSWMGSAVRPTRNHHQPQGPAIRFLLVVCTVLPPQHLPCADYRLSSTGKRCRGEIPSPPQRCAAGPLSRGRLVRPLAMGSARIRSAWRENLQFSPADAVFGAQPVLPGQFLNSPEPPSPAFFQELQHTLCNRTPPPADHHNRPGPLKLPEELMVTRYVLVRHDGAQPPLSPMYDGPYLVLERSLRFFRLQVGTRQDTVSTLRLKPCRSPPDVQPAVPPRCGRPPTSPAAASTPADVPRPPAPRRRRVTFRCPVVVPPPDSSPPPGPPPPLPCMLSVL